MKRLENSSINRLLLLTVGILAVTFMTLAVERVEMDDEMGLGGRYDMARAPQAIMAAPTDILPTSGPIVLPSGRQIAAAELFNAAGQPYFDHPE